MTQIDSQAAFTQPTPSSVSARIRRYRKSRALTLHDIEQLSQGRIKAVVMGSYERGTRAISLARTIEIANLFNIPVTELISEPARVSTNSELDMVFDLRKISNLVEHSSDTDLLSLSRYLKAISARRSDWNGEVLSLRKSDFDTLTLLIGKPGHELLQKWIAEKILITGPNHL
jgi:transcriptional regulator with XRE-family HTH domain